MAKAEVVIAQKKHLCSGMGCNQRIWKGEPAVSISRRVLIDEVWEWRREWLQPKCWERETGEAVVLPNYQPYLFKGEG